MSAQTRICKENFRLLDLTSSDSISEDLQLEIVPNRKKKVTRRERNRSTAPKNVEKTIDATELKWVLKWAVRLALITWLIILTWFIVALYDQITYMRNDISNVTTSSNSVSSSLQACHTAARELRANVSDIDTRLSQLETYFKSLEKKVDDATGELAAVSQQLAAAPKLADTPRRLAQLQEMVANFGSQINGFDGALTSARKQAATATSGLEEVKASIHELEARTNQTIVNSTINSQKDDELHKLVNDMNATLVSRIDSLQAVLNTKTTTLAPLATSKSTSAPISNKTILPPPPAETPMKPSVTP